MKSRLSKKMIGGTAPPPGKDHQKPHISSAQGTWTRAFRCISRKILDWLKKMPPKG